jgi:hypothetical protein
MSTDSR